MTEAQRNAADVIVGLDAGTSVIKAVAFDPDGRQLYAAARPNHYDHGPDGAVEQDLARTWTDTVAVLKELVDAHPDLPGRIAVLAVTGQGDGTWLVDRDGAPVAPGWLWLDSRAAGIVQEAARNGARERLYRLTGCGLNACNQSGHLVWLKRHRPEVLDRAETAFHCKDWLYFNLTGQRATDPSEGTFTFGDYRTRTYAPEILEALGIADLARLLPPMVDGATTTHRLTSAVAAATGLRAGTPVSLCYVDIVCSALSAGLYDHTAPVGCTIAGSTGMHMRWFSDTGQIALADQPTGYTIAFPVPGSAAQVQSNMASTLNIDWIVDCARQAAEALGHAVDRRTALATLDARVAEAQPGALLFHPYISEAGERGPFVDVAARAMVSGLSTRVGFLDLVRGIYEGLGFAARDCYAVMGGVPQEIRVCGGAARSRAFCQVLADVLGTGVRRTAQDEAGAAGAAMTGAVAVGALPDMATAVDRWVRPLLDPPIDPDPGTAGLYDRLFAVYQATRQAVRPLWPDFLAARNATPEARP